MMLVDLVRDLGRRQKNLRCGLEDAGLDGFLAGGERNVLYLSGKGAGRVLVTADEAVLWVRDLYVDVYSDLFSEKKYPLEVRAYEKDAVKKYVKEEKMRKLGVENIGVVDFRKMEKDLRVRLTPTDLVERLRSIKSEYEIGLIRKAADMAKKGMRKAEDAIAAGVKEVDAVAEVEAYIRRLGSETPPFEDGMLLASGPSAADIHARPQKKKIASGSLVVVDLGARFGGYHSDTTRTFSVGKAGGEEKQMLEFVEALELEAVDRLKAGLKASVLHEWVEKKLMKRGYKFYHSTGHGVGLNIHECPNIGPGSEDILAENMVFTVEPGVYVPKKFGVRFEDTVLLHKGRVEYLTRQR
jgi:Xaa-Pro aminopeptidase